MPNSGWPAHSMELFWTLCLLFFCLSNSCLIVFWLYIMVSYFMLLLVRFCVYLCFLCVFFLILILLLFTYLLSKWGELGGYGGEKVLEGIWWGIIKIRIYYMKNIE